MSYYEDERTRTRPARERSRRRDDYDYDDGSAYSPREKNRTTTLVKRRDSYSDVEEITRDFSPPGGDRGGYYRETTIRKSGVRPARSRSIDEDRYADDRYDNDRYNSRRDDRSRDDRRDRDRRRRHSSDYSDRSRSRSRSRSPAKKENKSDIEKAIESLGLGALVGGLLGKESKDSKERARSKSRSDRDRDRASSETRSDRHKIGPSKEQFTQAVAAALLAGAGEAFRSRKETGAEKGKRIMTAAVSAAGVDGLINMSKDQNTHRKRDAIGSAIAGIATSRVVNGARSKSRGRTDGRDPSGRPGRSQSRGGVGDLLAGGAVAAAAKKVYDNVRSRSRGRSVSPRYSDDSRSPPRSKSRRRSVSRAAARTLSAIGLTKAADKMDPDRHSTVGRNRDDYDDRSSYYDNREVGHPISGDVNDRARSVSQSRSGRQVDRSRSKTPGSYSLDFGPHHNGDPDTDSDSDLGSSSGEEKERKKSKKKLLLTTGLASIATIHAGHSVYQSYDKRRSRKQAVAAGKISPEEAKKRQTRDRITEAASVGVAAIGLKGAYSEWKEMNEHRQEMKEELEKMKRHHAKRQARRDKAAHHERRMSTGQMYADSGYASSMPNLQSPPPMNAPPSGWNQPFEEPPYYDHQGHYSTSELQSNVPHYYDDNPYANTYTYSADQMNGSTLPHPPVGSDHYPQQQRPPRERSPSRPRPGDRL